MEQTKEGSNTNEKMVSDVDSSSTHVEEFQPQKHDKDPGLNLRRTVSNHSAKKSRKKKWKIIKKLEDEAKMLQAQLAILKPEHERQKKQLQLLMEEEKALLKEMHDLQEKALLKDAENEKSMETIKMLKELRQKQVEELLKLDIDPFDSVFNAAPSCEGGSGSKSP
ncbi:ninein-like [Vigna radiata var. radiata]|uniref:Ninein-like n=1 Tax=Vigna radiata var. radiata TaxID=3916 RepID=A0A3Q0EPB8_VIGRR|nr:ninein-like [Vigna radiata var. radiata]